MSNERSNRTNKAQAIAAALAAVGVTATQTLDLAETSWRLAALAGWHIAAAEGVKGIAARPWTTVSAATRNEVAALLAAEAERVAAAELVAHETDDVFARIAAPHTGPQDPDAPVPSTAPEPAPVVKQLGSEWVVFSGGSSVGFADQDDANEYAATLGATPPATERNPLGVVRPAPVVDGGYVLAEWELPHPFVPHHEDGGDPCEDCGARESDPRHGTPATSPGAVRHPAAEHTLNCLAGFNTTGCQC